MAGRRQGDGGRFAGRDFHRRSDLGQCREVRGMDPPSEADRFVSIICEPREVPAGVSLAPQPERRQRTVTDHDPADTRCGRHRVIPRRSTRRPSTGAGPRDRLARNAARRATARRSSVQAQRAGHPAAGAAEMVGRAGKSASSQIQRITASGLTGQGAQAPFSAPRRRPPWGGRRAADVAGCVPVRAPAEGGFS